MKYSSGILATTHIDQQNEEISLSALESMVEQSNSYYIPITVEHDPRNPPLGRTKSTRIKKLEDGEYAIEGIFEMFESWENTVGRIFHQNEENLLLEFTATLDYTHQHIVEKYKNKIITFIFCFAIVSPMIDISYFTPLEAYNKTFFVSSNQHIFINHFNSRKYNEAFFVWCIISASLPVSGAPGLTVLNRQPASRMHRTVDNECLRYWRYKIFSSSPPVCPYQRFCLLQLWCFQLWQ